MPARTLRRFLPSLLLALTAAQCMINCGAAVAGQLPDPKLAKFIDNALSDQALKHGIKGVLIKSLDTGATLYEKNSEVLFVPASNFKLVASAAALDLLGPDYRMQTALYATSKPAENGVLNGDLILVGKGDPVFRCEDLQKMVDQLKDMGVRSINGDIIGDDSWFDSAHIGDGWQWGDLAYYYGTGISALNLNENVVEVYLTPGLKAGDRTNVRLQPVTGYMFVKNESTTGEAGTKATADADRMLGRNIIRVSGSLPVDAKPTEPVEQLSVQEPTLYACNTLKEMIDRSGIKFEGKVAVGVKPKDAIFVATHDSPPLSRMLALVNKPSDNLIAECLFKTIGKEVKGSGSADAARTAEIEWLKKIGADTAQIDIQDGSGLSRQDVVSPRNLVTILTYMYNTPTSKFYIDSLPVAGVDGTLKYRMKGTSAEGNVKAKTGTLNHVRSLSGYVTTKAGEHLVFSILMNNHLGDALAASGVQDKIVEALADLTEKTETKNAQAAH